VDTSQVSASEEGDNKQVAEKNLEGKCPHCDEDQVSDVCPNCRYRSPVRVVSGDNRNGGGNTSAWYVFIDQHIISVASYLGTAAAAGIVGNRADSVLLAAARRIFQSVYHRWHERADEEYGVLAEEEAVDAAIAAACTRGFEPSTLTIIRTEQGQGQWAIDLRWQCPGRPYCTQELHALVPSGDPGKASIILTGRDGWGQIIRASAPRCDHGRPRSREFFS
jgi:hypothetical protein